MFTRYPGKLFLIGEFAIMEPGSISVVSAVDHYLNITINKSDDYAIYSSHGNLFGADVFSNRIMPHVHASLKVLNSLIDFKPFEVRIESELEVKGKKIGFGSSGVVIVGILDSLLKFHDYKISDLELFKLACLVQLEMNEFSSGGDLAASVYRDTIVYQSYDQTWLMEQDFDVKTLIQQEWPNLKIEVLDVDDLFSIEIGWTGNPHSTNVSLQKMRHRASEDATFYETWVNQSNQISTRFIQTVKDKRFDDLSTEVINYQEQMRTLQEWLDIEIETKKLKELNHSSQYPSKISGSGGGDCGIIFLPLNHTPDYLENWKENDITLIEGGMIHEYTIKT